MAFPVSLASSLSISGTQPLSTYSHGTGVHVEDRNDIIALGRKLGLGTANAVASGTVALLGTGGTQSAWGQITNAYISGTAAIAVSKLGTVAASMAMVSDAGGTIRAGTIQTAMVAGSAITQSIIATGPTGADQTLSTTSVWTDITSMAGTFVATANSKWFIALKLAGYHSAANGRFMGRVINTVGGTTILAQTAYPAGYAANADMSLVAFSLANSPGAGTAIFKAQFQVIDAGTVSLRQLLCDMVVTEFKR